MTDGETSGVFVKGHIPTVMEFMFNSPLLATKSQELVRGSLWAAGDAVDHLTGDFSGGEGGHFADELKHLTEIRPVGAVIEQSARGEGARFKPSVGVGRGGRHLKISFERGGCGQNDVRVTQPLNIGVQTGLVIFDDPHIVAASLDN